ncbi:hypothetical protein EI94DRAFT_1331174 [Lactarius quietus]|nr:hypothetical protein EI94DRAFT_1331174 [Lactarius quietus]
MMDPSEANSREYQSLDSEKSICASRCNLDAPVSFLSLPTEIIDFIISFLRLPVGTSPIDGKSAHRLAGLSVTHTCRRLREIALNQPLFWSHVDVTNLSVTGMTEILARAKNTPLHLKAMLTHSHWDDARYCAFQKELQTRVSHIRKLVVSVESPHFRGTLEGLTSPAPTLEYLEVSHLGSTRPFSTLIPERLFDGTTPRLSHLILRDCNISWKSPLLRGLTHLNIRRPSRDARPSLEGWLDALNEMPRLRRLILESASPISRSSVEVTGQRIVTLPFLKRLHIRADAKDCALSLAHLDLPALTWLYLTPMSDHQDGLDVLRFLPYITRHTHGAQDTRPLRSVLFSSNGKHIDILAWPKPNIYVDVDDKPAFLKAADTTRVVLSIRCEYAYDSATHGQVLDAVMAALPLDNVVTLTAHTRICKKVWFSRESRRTQLDHVRLAASAARSGLRDLLLGLDKGGRESPLLPSLTKLVLIDFSLSDSNVYSLCNVLKKRVEQGVPLEVLDMRTCRATRHWVQMLGEIVADLWGPEHFDTVYSGVDYLDYPDSAVNH